MNFDYLTSRLSIGIKHDFHDKHTHTTVNGTQIKGNKKGKKMPKIKDNPHEYFVAIRWTCCTHSISFIYPYVWHHTFSRYRSALNAFQPVLQFIIMYYLIK